MWSRAWRFNNVWAIATIDILFTILWFAASIAVAVWNANGIAKGKDSSDSDNSSDKNTRRDDSNKSDGTCASFGYGSESKCEVSKASVGFGIVIMLLFAVTSYISVRAIIEYRRTGVVPNANMNNHGHSDKLDVEDPSKDAWSANTDELNHNTHDDDRLAYGQTMGDDQEGLLNRHSSDAHQPADGMHPGRRLSYQSPSQVNGPSSYDDNMAPSALSPTGLPTGPHGHVQFPEANYNALR